MKRGIEPKSQVSIVFSGAFQNDEMHRLVLRAMARDAERQPAEDAARRTRRHLRRQRRAELHPASDGGVPHHHHVRLRPGATRDLVRAAFGVIEAFKTDGPSDAQVADARAALMRDFETNSQQNGYLLNRLAVQVPVRRGRRGRCSTCGRRYDRLTAADASRGRADLPRHEPLCGSDAAARGAHAVSCPWGAELTKRLHSPAARSRTIRLALALSTGGADMPVSPQAHPRPGCC